MRLAVTAAAVCLSDASCTGAMRDLESTLALVDRYPFQPSAF
jgi:hypothetical protein